MADVIENVEQLRFEFPTPERPRLSLAIQIGHDACWACGEAIDGGNHLPHGETPPTCHEGAQILANLAVMSAAEQRAPQAA